MTRETRIRWVFKPLVFALSLIPMAWLAWSAFSGDLGANPIEAVNRHFGGWALRFILIGLAITPLCELSGWRVLARFRRMAGLFAFFYAAMHATSYVALDQFFAWGEIWADILKRNYITIGVISLSLLTPLAVTSTNGMIKRLGGRRWRKLHRLVYPAAVAAVFHFFMMVKADLREPLVYAGILALLLGYRVAAARRKARRTGAVHGQATPQVF